MNKQMNTWSERCNFNKKRFKEVYGRKPNKEEIKLLRKGLVDLKMAIDPDRYVGGGERSIAEKISVKKMSKHAEIDV